MDSAPTLTSAQVNAPADKSAEHPLGPLIYRYAPIDRRAARRRALIITAATAALLLVSFWLEPDPAGLGTHTQLGIARCTWPATVGVPCPTCGMTTAFALTVRGRFIAAFRVQPMGMLLACTTFLVLLFALREAWTLRAWRVNWYRVRPLWCMAFVTALVLGAWLYKILAFRAAMR